MMELLNNTPRDQNYKKAYALMGRVLEKYNAPLNDFYKKKYDSYYDLYPGFCNRLFWELCLPKVEFGARVKESVGSDAEVHSSIKRYKSFVSMSPKVLFRSIISYATFLCWLIYCLITNKKNRIFVEDFILSDSRFINLHQSLEGCNKMDFVPIFTRYSSPYSYSIIPSYNLLRLLKNKCTEYLGAQHMWHIAILLLKPKKIIIRDDGGRPTYSLVLAAKKTNTEVIALSHGLLPPWQGFAYGFRKKSPKKMQSKKPLLFDRYYVWDEILANALKEVGSLYNKEVRVCGWLHTKQYNKINYATSKKIFALYPIEHFAGNRVASLKLLEKLHLNGFHVVIKNRPGHPYSSIEFENKLFLRVDEFSDDHLNNAFCAVGIATTMMFQLSMIGLPILSPIFDHSYDFNSGIKLPFLNYSIEEIKTSPKECFVETQISDDFVREFVTDSNDNDG